MDFVNFTNRAAAERDSTSLQQPQNEQAGKINAKTTAEDDSGVSEKNKIRDGDSRLFFRIILCSV
jgi:hypothetical protein